MQLLQTTTLTAGQAAQINGLWDTEYPASLNGRFPLLLEGVDRYGHLLLVDRAGAVAGWAAWFEKEGEVRFSILVASAHQGKGLGKRLIKALQARLDVFYGWVVDGDRYLRADGSPYRTPLAFYRKLGFDVLTDQRLETPLLATVKVRWQGPAAPGPAA